MTYLGRVQGPTHKADLRLFQVELWAADYFPGIDLRTTERRPIGMIDKASYKAPESKDILDVTGGNPEVSYKQVITATPQPVDFAGLEILPENIRLALGGQRPVAYTFGTETACNDGAGGKDNANVADATDIEKSDLLLINRNGKNYEARCTGNSNGNITWAPDLPSNIANGETIKRVMTAELWFASDIKRDLTLWTIMTDQYARQLVDFYDLVNFGPKGKLFEFPHKGSAKLNFSGQSLGFPITLGGETKHVVRRQYTLEGEAKLT